ncbi:MAG: hypothetical protein A3H95_13015 [Acidobacteria bacterium RIFCSPLOWO2_02_FULL_64_15]|nr:MAG: hypothetical protein A3H95_13015 [Acidobacteria bacterium RIFCSPLOWO2_02_FULL_64_15]
MVAGFQVSISGRFWVSTEVGIHQSKFVQMVIKPTHRVLDSEVEIPEGIRQRDLDAAPHERCSSAQDDQELMNELRTTSCRVLRCTSADH